MDHANNCTIARTASGAMCSTAGLTRNGEHADHPVPNSRVVQTPFCKLVCRGVWVDLEPRRAPDVHALGRVVVANLCEFFLTGSPPHVGDSEPRRRQVLSPNPLLFGPRAHRMGARGVIRRAEQHRPHWHQQSLALTTPGREIARRLAPGSTGRRTGGGGRRSILCCLSICVYVKY